jgi:hypothetical protein
MSEQLALYLNDHLAGARFAIELLERLRDSRTNQRVADVAAQVLPDIEEDRDVLQKLADDAGTGGSPVKEAASWLAEKASRLKLRLTSDGDLGAFEALETLSLGVLGKLKLWRALSQIKISHRRLQQLDFDILIARAQSQHDELEKCRLELARAVLA